MELALLGALIIGLSLGLLGSGGSILTVPVLLYLVGESEKLAIAESLAIVGCVAAAGAIPYARRRLIVWRAVLAFGVPGMAGAYLGAALSTFVSGTFQLTLFALIMVAAAVLMLRPPALDPSATARASWKIALDGLIVGILTGLVGVGGGFLIVPALVLLGGLPIDRAVGTSLAIIALKSAAGYTKYHGVLASLDLQPDIRLIGVMSAVGAVGTLAGGQLGRRLPQNLLRKLFGGFLIVMALAILADKLPALIRSAG